jgi:hypothetical protein
MVAGDRVQPVLKIPDVMLQEAARELFKDFHYGILCIIFIVNVFEADTIYKVGIPGKEFSDHLVVLSFPIIYDQFMIGEIMKVGTGAMFPEPEEHFEEFILNDQIPYQRIRDGISFPFMEFSLRLHPVSESITKIF